MKKWFCKFHSSSIMDIENKSKHFVELIYGIIRKIKPKKIVEIWVSNGGSSALILNSIKDIENERLFSIFID